MKTQLLWVLACAPFLLTSCLDCTQPELQIMNEDDNGWEVYINDVYEAYLLPDECHTVSLPEGYYQVRAYEDDPDSFFEGSCVHEVELVGCETTYIELDY